MKINSGIDGSYSQVGKIITVYPETPDQAVGLARRLHKLTMRLAAPSVPFDLKYIRASNISYRFGAFHPFEIEHSDGRRTPAMHGPTGALIADNREEPKPEWVIDPFESLPRRRQSSRTDNPLACSYRVIRALAQRGKGGVYQAFDLTVTPPRLCLLKEGRKHGELTWTGRDGRWRVKHEERVLTELRSQGLDVPRIYSAFELESNAYLVTEFVEGESLHNLLARRQKRLSLFQVLSYGLRLAQFFSQLNDARWVWRDCKPLNIIVTGRGDVKPLDFEGACRADRFDGLLWGTPGFIPPEHGATDNPALIPQDLYALGAIVYLLATGRVPELINPPTAKKLRRNLPAELDALIMQLLGPEPGARPSAGEVVARLSRIERRLSVSDQCSRPFTAGGRASNRTD